jgi:hypothetical protein
VQSVYYERSVSAEERQLTRRSERELYKDQRGHWRRLKEGRFMRKVQNRKAILTTVTFVVNVKRTISRQQQNLTGFSVENAENVCMNPVARMGCF